MKTINLLLHVLFLLLGIACSKDTDDKDSESALLKKLESQSFQSVS